VLRGARQLDRRRSLHTRRSALGHRQRRIIPSSSGIRLPAKSSSRSADTPTRLHGRDQSRRVAVASGGKTEPSDFGIVRREKRAGPAYRTQAGRVYGRIQPDGKQLASASKDRR